MADELSFRDRCVLAALPAVAQRLFDMVDNMDEDDPERRLEGIESAFQAAVAAVWTLADGVAASRK